MSRPLHLQRCSIKPSQSLHVGPRVPFGGGAGAPAARLVTLPATRPTGSGLPPGVAFEYATRLPHRVSAVIGHSISYRGAEASLATLQTRFSAKKRLLLCWVESEVHLIKKGQTLAKAAGVKIWSAQDGEGVLEHAVKFLGGLQR